jgi:hypothetical protein
VWSGRLKTKVSVDTLVWRRTTALDAGIFEIVVARIYDGMIMAGGVSAAALTLQ